MLEIFYIMAIVISLCAFVVALLLANYVKKMKSENKIIKKIGEYIKEGANTFLKREFKALSKFVIIIMVIIFVLLPKPLWKYDDVLDIWPNILMSLCYLAGNFLSGLAGKIGINIATTANVKASEAAKEGIKPSFIAGFRGGAVMGMAVVGSSLLGVTLLFWLIYSLTGSATILLGFSFGASSMALFAKAGGGIFTKTADISADLVGKVELNIPEDDPRNPAVIADNVGDNVGDVAGMGADLFDSNVASIVAALVLAISLNPDYISLVFCYAAFGLLASIIGILTAKIGKNGNPTKALNSSTYLTTAIFCITTAIISIFIDVEGKWYIWGAATLGLLVGVIIGIATDFFTDDKRLPVHKVAKASSSGPAFTILSGTSYGFISTFPAMVGIAISALISYKLCYQINDTAMAGMFGIAIAAVGMLSIVGMIISNDAYGPIVDNARGLAEMGGLGDDVIEITDELDSAGNTVKAITKGFAIGAAGLTVIALLGAFMSEVNTAAINLGKIELVLNGFDIMDPTVFFGILIGASLPAVFSALLILGVDKNAQRMIKEIHRQFDEIPGLKEGKEGITPEYNKCIDIATTGALKELVGAGVVAILLTLLVGFIGGVKAIGGFLLGNITVGLFLALFMSNAGGLWDNTKKYVEAGNEGGKGSSTHKAAVVGDTVGDPYKDTAGPSINTQITVVSLVASLMASIFLTCSIF